MISPAIQAGLLLGSALVVCLLGAWLTAKPRGGNLTPLLVSTSSRTQTVGLVLVSIVIWQVGQALEYLVPDHAVLFHRIAFVGIILLPAATLQLCLRIGGFERPPSWLLFVVPSLSIGINLSGDFTDFLWAVPKTANHVPGTALPAEGGPWFGVHMAFSYLCSTGSFAILCGHFYRNPLRWMEGAAMILALVLPTLASVAEVVMPWGKTFPVTPLVLSFTAGLITWATLQDGRRQLMPRARQKIIEAMGDSVFVLDRGETVIDANRAGWQLLGVEPGSTTPLAAFPSLREFVLSGRAEADVSFQENGDATDYHAVRSFLDDEEAISVLVLRDVTQVRTSQERIRQLAYYDSLTGLPNRRLFRKRLENALDHARESGGRAAVLVIDVDRFKQINDTLGHAAGDQLLSATGERFLECLRPQDQIAFSGQASVSRIGGDEFVVLLTGLNERHEAQTVAERLVQRFQEPVRLEGQDVFVSMSVGIACFPEDADHPSALLKRADRAMYRAKGKPGSAIADSGLADESESAPGISVEAGLHRALQGGELELYYQPIYASDLGQILGTEALIRWNHPDGRLIGPGEFIPQAEDTGLVDPIGRWAIANALEQIQKWRELAPSARVSVNVSPVQLLDRKFIPYVKELLEDVPDPSALEFELTERFLMDDLDRCERSLTKIAEMGVSLSLDDFGTGFSSLAYLHSLPFHKVKIDRSFVVGLPDSERSLRICRAIIDMAHGLGLRVVAEGIENEEQLRTVHGLGCDAVQGFGIGRPQPADQLVDVFAREAARLAVLNPSEIE